MIEASCLRRCSLPPLQEEYDFRTMLAAHFTPHPERLSAAGGARSHARQALFLRGEPGDALYNVERGRVAVSLPLADGRSGRLRSFGPGTVVGEMAVYTQNRAARVLAKRPRVSALSLQTLLARADDP